jgi:peptidase E
MIDSHPARRIFAMGGATLLPDSGNLKFERQILDLTGASKPRVCFVGTASGDDAGLVVRFLDTYAALGAATAHVRFFARTPADLREIVFGCDVVQVGGGNTRSMLAVWRHWEFDTILREAYARGIVMCGSSAGSICWFESGVTDSVAGPLTAMSALGFIEGSNCPHYDSEPARRPAYHAMIASGDLPAGYACDDGSAVVFENERFVEAVCSRPAARAYRVQRGAAGVVETALAMRAL